MTRSALIVVDMQNDFMPGGTLGVHGGDEIVPIINRLLKFPFDIIVASKDWHPKDHCSFANTHGKKVGDTVLIEGSKQQLWPVHCVAQTKGAMFTAKLDTTKFQHIFHKGTEQNIDSYSTFFDNEHKKSTGLGEFLKSENVTDVYLLGLTTEYCVKYSAMDALHLGFKTHVILDACRAVNIKSDDENKAVQEMQRAGIHIINEKDINLKK